MIYKLINNEDKILETPTDSFDFDNPIVEPKEFAPASVSFIAP